MKEYKKNKQRDILCELHGVPLRVPSASKYKRNRHEKKDGPILEVGKKAVLSVNNGMDRVGYYLAVLVDWYEPLEKGWWSSNTTLYFVALDASNDKLEDRRGRLVSARWPNPGWWQGQLSVVSWDESFFRRQKK